MIFYKESKKKGGWARVNEIFYKESKSKINIFFFLGGGGGGGGKMGFGWADRPKPNCPFNFFEVGGITMHKCTSYGPDKLNL